MNNLTKILFLIPIAFLSFSCEEDVDDVINDNDTDDDNSINVVEMTVGNSGASAYFVSEIMGNEDVTSLSEDNSTWKLIVGTRYELTVSGASVHPFALRDSENIILLSMNNVEGSFEGDLNVDFQSEGTSFSFTLTQELADELDNYVCTAHLGMTGRITTN